MNILDLLDSKGIFVKINGPSEISIHCPNASNHEGGDDSNPSFNINIDRMVGACFSCGFKMGEVGLTRWLTGEDLDEGQLQCLQLKGRLKRIEKEMGFELPLPSSSNIVLPPVDRMWNEDYRGIRAETWQLFNTYFCNAGKYKERLVIPLQFNGRLHGFETRATGDAKPKYLRNPGFDAKGIPWPLDYVRSLKPEYVILTEGIMDCINLIDKGFPALCNWGVTSFSTAKLIQILSLGCRELILAFDKDDAGSKGEQAVIELSRNWIDLSVGYKEHFQIDEKLTEEKGKVCYCDCGDLTREEIEVMVGKRVRVK